MAFDGSQSSENALLESFKLASDEKSWITVATVVPEYSGDLDLTGVANVQKTLLRQGEALLSRAASTAQREGALIKTVLEEGDVYERLVNLQKPKTVMSSLSGGGASLPSKGHLSAAWLQE